MKWIRYGCILAFITAATLAHYLLASLWGVLVLSLVGYFAARDLLGIEVLSAGQLLQWFSDLSEGAQVAVSAGGLTAVGLVAAYWTAMVVWKTQRRIDLYIAAAEEIQTRWLRTQRVLNDLSAFVGILQESAERALTQPDPNEQRYALVYANNQAQAFEQLRKQLYESRMEFTDLFGLYGTLLTAKWFVFDKLRAVGQLLDDAWSACCFIPPRAEYSNHSFVAEFLSKYDAAACERALEATGRAAADGATAIGFVTGQMRANVFVPTTSTAIIFARYPRLFAHGMQVLSKLKAPKEDLLR